MKHFWVRLSLVLCVLALSSYLSLMIDCVDLFHAMLGNLSFSLGARALSLFLIKMGCSGGLALTIAFFVSCTLTDEGAAFIRNSMLPHSEGTAGERLPLPAGEESPVPSISSQGSSWIETAYGDGGEASALASHQGQPSQDNPYAGASSSIQNSPSRVIPYPYQPDEVIGGDSVASIQRRLLAKYSVPSAAEIQHAEIEAQDLFEVKVEIFRVMEGLDPQGDWMGRGNQALSNPRTKTGEESLDKLYTLLSDLQTGGVNSEAFSQLKRKVPLRRG